MDQENQLLQNIDTKEEATFAEPTAENLPKEQVSKPRAKKKQALNLDAEILKQEQELEKLKQEKFNALLTEEQKAFIEKMKNNKDHNNHVTLINKGCKGIRKTHIFPIYGKNNYNQTYISHRIQIDWNSDCYGLTEEQMDEKYKVLTSSDKDKAKACEFDIKYLDHASVYERLINPNVISTLHVVKINKNKN